MEKENFNGKRKKKGKKSSSEDSENKSKDSSKSDKPAKVKTPKRAKNTNTIGISKQLSEKLKSRPQTRSSRSKTKNDVEPRVCGNGKPMPTLSELEKMFEDSDDEDGLTVQERCKTPDKQPILSEDKILSPTTIKDLSNKMMDIISNSVLNVNDGPPPRVVPPKKRKKPEVPYIVGCKDRKQVIKKSTVVIGKSHDKYGIEQHSEDDDDDIPKKRKRSGKSATISKSIFNPMSEEIAAILKNVPDPDTLSDGSADSNKTVSYDYNSHSPNSRQRSFSPLPSTSKDNETILKNELRFNESLLKHNNANDSSQSDIEVIELPCETIIVNDEMPDKPINNRAVAKDPDIEEVTYLPRAPTFDTFEEDDMYSSVVIDVDEIYCDNDCEIIDVDEVIAENKTLIDKIRKDNQKDTVTHVKPTTIIQRKTEPVFVEANKESTNTQNKRESIECVVTDFFKNTNTSKPSQNVVETIDLSNSVSDISMFRNVVDSVISCAQSLVKSFAPFTQQLQGAATIDTNVQSTSSTNNRLNNVHINQISNFNNPQTVNVRNRPNVDIQVNITSNNPRKRKRTPATTIVPPSPKSVAVPPSPKPVVDQTTPVRNIGDCPICMENLSNTTIASTICGHIFCMPCIKAALQAGGKKCPTCRKSLKGAGYHQLFL